MDEHIEDLLEEMRGSLKRAEHSYLVTLKYSRTVDVMENLLERYANTLALGLQTLLEFMKSEGKLEEVPSSLIERIEEAKELFKDDEIIQECTEFLLFLRKLNRADHGSAEEFRRHVTMSVQVEGKEFDINIDVLSEYYERVEGYIKHIRGLIEGFPEE